ncbi:hypothetical protein CAPTEDRAFT_194461 [Capitella teleta]|uniref:Uncharacterized protein n=1 Tax=Capitella teleta TaxID=283909 RepID=R7UKQ3_CAPTE|nr:hypothetical protein CAPTEDRAFT_194461 [Capitella teleta]|eukprot:ELU06815.1 hypothetical protein CAPTEDRAFT_194461 [Capitella teleta]
MKHSPNHTLTKVLFDTVKMIGILPAETENGWISNRQIFFLHPCNITSWRCVLSCRFAGFSLSHYTCGTMWAKGFSSPTGNPYPKANVSKPALEQRQLPTLLNSTNAATGFLHSDFHIQTRFVSHGNTLHATCANSLEYIALTNKEEKRCCWYIHTTGWISRQRIQPSFYTRKQSRRNWSRMTSTAVYYH